jgi:hypothetical protein
MLAIINAAAEAYRGIIPADRWHVLGPASRDICLVAEDIGTPEN